jgi:hypothetical protein
MNNIVVPVKVLEEKRKKRNLSRGIALAVEFFNEARQYQKDWIFQDVPMEFVLIFVNSIKEVSQVISGQKGDEALYTFGRALTASGKMHLDRIINIYQNLPEHDDFDTEGKEAKIHTLFVETFSLLRDFLIQCGVVSETKVETRFYRQSLPAPSFELGGITFTTA